MSDECIRDLEAYYKAQEKKYEEMPEKEYEKMAQEYFLKKLKDEMKENE